MAAPTAQNITRIVTEGLAQAGIPSPTSSQNAGLFNRAKTEWLEQIKNYMADKIVAGGNYKLRSLQATDVQVGVVGQSKYSMPSDLMEIENISILDATNTGTAQAGAAATITLESGEDASEEDVEGNPILITAGTGAGSYEEAKDYDTSTLVATMIANWSTQPDSTSTYWIIDKQYKVNGPEGIEDLDSPNSSFSKSRPDRFVEYDLDSNGYRQIYFNKPLDKTYGIRTRYYVDLNLVDLTSVRMTRIYRLWQSVFIQGISAWVYKNNDDNNYRTAIQIFEQMVVNKILRENPDNCSSRCVERG
jgi:hypothetical protein